MELIAEDLGSVPERAYRLFTKYRWAGTRVLQFGFANGYGTETIHERHRHRYEVNNDYRTVLQEHGMMLSGISPDGRIVEMIELPDHPWFVATQAHPELKSRPNRPHPLFKGFIEASLDYQEKHK